MNPDSLTNLTWATLSAAVLSALLLSTGGDAGLAGWHVEPTLLTASPVARKPARTERQMATTARPGTAPRTRPSR